MGWSYPELPLQAKCHTLIIIIIIIMKREKEREREGGREKEGGRDRDREREREKRDRHRHKDKKRKRERETHFLVQPKGAYLSLSCNTVCNHDNRKPRPLMKFPTHPSHGYCSEGPDQVTLDTCRRLKREYL